LKSIKLLLPSPDEQQAILAVLGSLDDKIELNRRMNETLEAMARAIFKSWFVDFDPVRAKANGQPPPGLSAEIADLLPDSFEDTEPAIPTGWKMGKLDDVATHPRRTVNPGDSPPGTPYIGLEHMPRQSIALSDWGVSDDVASNKFAFKKGEILFGKLRPYFHKVGPPVIDGVCSTDIVVVAPKQPCWFSYVLAVVSSTDFVNHTTACSTGTRMPRTNWKDMASYDIAVPPEPVAEAFNSIVAPFVEKIHCNILESKTLAEIRDTLLPKLLSGEIRVGDLNGGGAACPV
jgi:type I restriction enzyme S subunit